MPPTTPLLLDALPPEWRSAATVLGIAFVISTLLTAYLLSRRTSSRTPARYDSLAAAAPIGKTSPMRHEAATEPQPTEDGCIDELRMELSPRLSAIESLADVVEEFGDSHNLPETPIYFVNLEIDELMTNYVAYAFRKVRHPRMEVTLRAFNDKLILIVQDTGPPFNPLDAPAPDLDAGLDERQLGGMGLHLLRKYADRVRYKCVDGANILTLEHDFPGKED